MPDCLACNRPTNAEHVCPRCITTARDNLAEIIHLTHNLREQAIHHADHTSAPGHPVLGGEAMAMLGPTSTSPRAQIRQLIHRARLELDNDHVLDHHAGDHEPPLSVLAGWAQVWRDFLGHHTQLTATLDREASYLNQHMHLMAQVVDIPFDEFARALSQCRRHLEDVLHDGTREERGAPCTECGTPLIRPVTPAGLSDDYECRTCHRHLTGPEYRLAVAIDYRTYALHAPALTALELSDQLGVSRGSVTAWASLGKVRRRGRNLDGRVLYDVADVRHMLALRTGRPHAVASEPDSHALNLKVI
jgi:hypothetical protein